MAKFIKFNTSFNTAIFYASSLTAAEKYAEKNGLGSVFVKDGTLDKDDVANAVKIAPGVWQPR